MLLGKRPRPPMKRTTSMTEFTLSLDLNNTATGTINNNIPRSTHPPKMMHLQTPHFLNACHLCKRRLIAGRDIFMYRGDSAFCSLECRQQQMNQDEKKEKCSISSNKHNTPIATTSPNVSETVAAM